MPVPFLKAEGGGNDLVMVDGRAAPLGDPADWAVRLCRRHYGVGGDGLMLLESGPDAGLLVRMFNPDGTEDFCGNGLRCVAAWLADRGELNPDAFILRTPKGAHRGRVRKRIGRSFEVEVELVPPVFAPEGIPATLDGERILDVPLRLGDEVRRVSVLNVGTAHAILFVDHAVSDDEFRRVSPQVETHPAFPERVSVLWCRQCGPESLELRIWERGVGETISCGTGAGAAVVAAHLLGRIRNRAEVVTKGGASIAEWDESGPVRLTGPARLVYTGIWEER